jgi:hypothetical protein
MEEDKEEVGKIVFDGNFDDFASSVGSSSENEEVAPPKDDVESYHSYHS